MIERETEIIIQITLESTIGNKQHITLQEVLNVDVPKGIKTYMQTEVVNILQRDLQMLERFALMVRTRPAVEPMARTFLRSLSPAYVFSREEFETLTENAVHFLENYLCRPQWTLNQLMFGTKERVPFQDIVNKFEYVAHYLYYPRLVERLGAKKGWMEISAMHFRSLLKKIDAQVIKEHNARELALLAKPIFDFLLLGDRTEGRTIPISPILVFFEDKGMNAVRDYIERIGHIRAHTELSLRDLVTIIEDLEEVELEVGAEHHSPAPDTESGDGRSEETLDIGQIENPVSEETSPPDRSSMDPDELNQEGEPSPPAEPPRPRNVALSLTYAGLSHDAHPPDNGIEHLLSKDQERRFIKKLFKKDEPYYRVFIKQLNEAPTWKEASERIRELFTINELDPHMDEAIEFTDLVQQRYSPDTKRQQ